LGARDIAERVEITERAAQRTLADLIADGHAARTKVGRRKHYEINARGNLRQPVIGPVLKVLEAAVPPERRRTPQPS
jgi:predicted ArsR family transcriptional regulator